MAKQGLTSPHAGHSTSIRLLRNDDLIAVSVGEPYAGPVKAAAVTAAPTSAAAAAAAALVPAPQLTGSDDAGKQYESLAALWAEQAANVDTYNEANSAWWDADGYGGSTDDEAMIGDGGSEEDTNHSLKLLDELRAKRPMWQVRTALDCGAGVGRVTKHVLLKRCESVCLLEPCEKWHKQSKRYLGKKRSMSCSFDIAFLLICVIVWCFKLSWANLNAASSRFLSSPGSASLSVAAAGLSF